MEPARFGPGGVVWASTVVRITVGDREPPYGLAYVNLDDGPRVLAHIAGTEPVAVGTRVLVSEAGAGGPITVEVEG